MAIPAGPETGQQAAGATAEPAGVIVLDASAQVIDMNSIGESMAGMGLQQASGKPIQEVLSDPVLSSLVLYALVSARPVETAVEGGHRCIRVQSERLLDEDGRIAGARLLLSERSD
jgi:nitrogen fixation/metabolism regulation signal transduction histidine kinase